MIIPSLRFLSFFNKIYTYTDKSVLKQFWRWVYCIQRNGIIISRVWWKSGTEIWNFFALNVPVSRMEQTLIFQSSLHPLPRKGIDFPSSLQTLRNPIYGSLFHRREIYIVVWSRGKLTSHPNSIPPHIESLALTRARNASSRQNPSNPRTNAGNIIVHSTNSAIIY